MARLWRRQTQEMVIHRSPGLRLLPAMLIGVAFAGGITYFALGLKPKADPRLPELVVRVEGERLRLPDDSLCPVAHHGCDAALQRLPPAELRVVAPPDAMFAYAAPALAVAASAHREALLDDGTGAITVEPMRGAGMKDWAEPNSDLASLRLRVIMKADG